MKSKVLSLDESKLTPSRASLSRLLQFLLIFLVLITTFSILSVYLIRFLGDQNVFTQANPKPKPYFEEPIRLNLESFIRVPEKVWHEMNDSELFWRASFVPLIRDYPFKRIPKIAFMFLTRGPLPFSPLWERFFKGNEGLYSVYVHTLPSYRPDFPSSSVFYQRQIPSQVAEWGRMSMCDAERRLLANALLDISNEWFILLSEACIPLHSFNIIYRYISRSRFSFMGSDDVLGPYGRGRYNDQMAPEVNLTEWRKGSQWFEVNRKLALDIVGDVVFYPKFEEFCRPACYVDEHYFPTMLSIQSPNLLANRSITWVDWSRGGPHPATFGKGDVTKEFFEKIIEGQTCIYNNQQSSVCFLFARKFAPSALDPLLEHAMEFFGF